MRPSLRSLATAAACTALLVGLGAACTDDGGGVRDGGSGSASGSGSGSGSGSTTDATCETVGADLDPDTEVAVALDEFTLTADPEEAAAGNVVFDATNEGTEPHELVVVKGTPGSEIVDGRVDEEALDAADAFVGEIAPFPADETCAGTFALEAGDYTLLCNIVEEEDGTTISHLEEGMITGFTVTG